MLTVQGSELERAALLNKRLAFTQNEDSVPDEQLLLKLLLADAEYWTTGSLKLAVETAKQTKKTMSSRSMDDLNNIEVSTEFLEPF